MKLHRNGRHGALLVGMALVALPALASQAQRDGHHNEAQREQWQKVAEIFEALQIKAGSAVADVGAGDGFFTKRLSAAVGADGRVFAVDIGTSTLRRLRTRVADEGLANVEVVEGAVDDPRLAPASLDAALIVNAYHEMTEHQAMLAKIKAALRPGGRLVIVEPIVASRRSGRREEQTRNHEIAMDFVREDARAAGFSEIALQDPFTRRPHGNDEEWMLVLAPSAAAPGGTANSSRAAVQTFSSANHEWKAPELRIPVEEFKRLAAGGQVLVLDVRDPASYRRGHLPGALLMTAEELSTADGAARLKGERRLIVTYCS